MNLRQGTEWRPRFVVHRCDAAGRTKAVHHYDVQPAVCVVVGDKRYITYCRTLNHSIVSNTLYDIYMYLMERWDKVWLEGRLQ